ncbi:hypothetical protein LBMAG53_24770 [Planctomycetota bacterium]|nr:hypothetical protein LBMAG53_24770 [Planctomycetota bacterium]
MPIAVTEDLLRAVVTKDKALSDGRTLAKKGALQKLQTDAERSLIWGECQGSGATPYVISIDLAGDSPTIRCTCPVKPPPCKHTLAMLVAFMEKPASFAVAEPPAELLEKRAKIVERAEKKAEAATKPKEVDQAALAKKTKVQREALDLLERMVLDTAGAGLGALSGDKAAKLAEQARQLTDAYLPGAAEALRRLAALATPDADADRDRFYQLVEPGSNLPDDLRHRLMVRHLTRLWAMVRKGQKALDDKLDEGESAAAAEAVVEDLLGHVWDLAALKAKGHWRTGLRLFELADERYLDHVRGERVEQSFLLDLDGGDVLVDRKFRPFAALDKIKEKDSYERPFTISEAGIYPGFINRRVRWEAAALTSRPTTTEDFTAIHARALGDLSAALARYKEQIRNPLAPDDAVVLVRAADLRQAGAGIALIDAKGAALLIRDADLARCRTTNNLAMAAAAHVTNGTLSQPASLLIRLHLGLADDAIHGQALALVAGNTHIRLGM